MSLADKYVPPIHMWYYELVRAANYDEPQVQNVDSDSNGVETDD